MPAQYDLPEYTNAFSQEDVNKYNKLPFYLATMAARRFPVWDTYNKLWGKIPWQANMGTTMKGVEAVNTPVGRQFFYPNPITQLPNKDVFETVERTEQCNILMHDFDSKEINFLPSFQDFRENQIDFTHDDIVRQMSIANDMFIRSVMFQKSPYVFVVGNTAPGGLGSPELISAPYIPGGMDITQANVDIEGKNAAWLTLIAATIGAPGIKLTTIDRMVMTLRDDLGAPFFENTLNTPKDNELIKGKYVFIGSLEAYQNLKWDENLAKFRNVDWNIVVDGFAGSPFNELTWKSERYPLRFDNAGAVVAPELQTAGGDTVPNTAYNNAPNEIGFMVGADAYKTIKVGPPPKEFAGGSISIDKFMGMNWNGEVRLTRDILIKYADGTYSTNSRGRFLKFESALTMGCLPVRPRNVIPVLYKRQRVAQQAA